MAEISIKVLDLKIAPRLDRVTHRPIGGDWLNGDYPGHGPHGSSSVEWDRVEWETAINVFEDRIYGRFLNFISMIERKRYAGFAVMALDCLLIETLQQFFDGKDESARSGASFRRFLTTSSFQPFFGNDQTDKGLAGIFYNQVRCGILHMAEVKTSSKLTIKETEPIVRLSDDQRGIVVNRRLFHQQLLYEYNQYLSCLRASPIQYGIQPWKNFMTKMDFICKV